MLETMLNKYRGEIILFVVTIIAASGWFFSKNALIEFPPLGFMGLRFSIAFLLYLPFAYRSLKQLSSEQIWRSCAVGLCYAIYLTLWLFGLVHSEHFGEGAFLVSLAMLISPLLSWWIFKDRPHRIFWIALPIAALGLLLLALSKGTLHFSLGSLIFLSSSLCGAIYFVLNNQFSRHIPVLALTTLQVGVVGIFCSGYSLLFETFPDTISAPSWGWFLAALLLATNARMLLQTIGQKYCHVANAAIIMILEPVWTLLFSILLLGEQLNWSKTLGCLCILGALVVYQLPIILKKKTPQAQ